MMERWQALLRDVGVLEGGASGLDADAAAVVDVLSQVAYRPGGDVELVRKRYSKSLSRFLAPLEAIGTITPVTRSDGGAPMTILHPLHAPSGPLPALVYLHGGCWTFGDLGLYEPFLRRLANTTGRVVVAVEYRLAPEHPFPAALEDAWNAVEWVAANAAGIGVDADQIAIGGDDAGGNLAAVTALAARDGLVAVALQFQLLIYPCLDLTASLPSHASIVEVHPLTRALYAWCRGHYVAAFPDLEDWHLSPLFADDLRAVAPAIIVFAGHDPLRDEAALYGSHLRQAGVAIASIAFPQLMHGFVTMAGAIPAAMSASDRIAAAIKTLCGSSLTELHSRDVAAQPRERG